MTSRIISTVLFISRSLLVLVRLRSRVRGFWVILRPIVPDSVQACGYFWEMTSGSVFVFSLLLGPTADAVHASTLPLCSIDVPVTWGVIPARSPLLHGLSNVFLTFSPVLVLHREGDHQQHFLLLLDFFTSTAATSKLPTLFTRYDIDIAWSIALPWMGDY